MKYDFNRHAAKHWLVMYGDTTTFFRGSLTVFKMMEAQR